MFNPSPKKETEVENSPENTTESNYTGFLWGGLIAVAAIAVVLGVKAWSKK